MEPRFYGQELRLPLSESANSKNLIEKMNGYSQLFQNVRNTMKAILCYFHPDSFQDHNNIEIIFITLQSNSNVFLFEIIHFRLISFHFEELK